MRRHPHPQSARQLGEAVRRACVEAALAGYEGAAISGLCHEGAWEAAVSAIRSLDLDVLAEAAVPADPERSTRASVTADSAAAGTGALAAALLEGVAALSALRGPEGFRKRARAIASRAVTLQASLDAPVEAAAATDSILEIAARCTQVTTLAAEVAKEGPEEVRHEAAAALRLAASAAECALAVAEENLRAAVATDRTRSARRRSWRTRLLLRRARPTPEDSGSE